MKRFTHLLLSLLVLTVMGCRSNPATDIDCSNPSTPGCGPVVSPLNAPVILSVNALSTDKLKVSWNNPSASVGFSLVLEKKGPSDTTFLPVQSIASSASTNIEVVSLSAGTTYAFRMKALSEDDSKFADSSYSAEASGTTLGSGQGSTTSCSVPANYPVPTLTTKLYEWGVNPNLQTAVELNVSYSPSTNLGQYLLLNAFVIERKGPADTTWNAITTAVATPWFAWRDFSPISGAVQYRIRVQYSDLSTCTSGASTITAKLATPTNFAGQVVTLQNQSESIQFTWGYGTSPSEHVGYRVQYMWIGSGSNYPTFDIPWASTRIYTHLPSQCSSVGSGNSIYYRIQALSNQSSPVEHSDFGNWIEVYCP